MDLSSFPNAIDGVQQKQQPESLPLLSNPSENRLYTPAIIVSEDNDSGAPEDIYSATVQSPRNQTTPLKIQDDQPTLWVFGYGSLLWKTDFTYRSKRIGFIKGYERRFYQGNTTFRGRPGQPGRVANLEQIENGKTWGVAFEVNGQEEVAKVLRALYTREVMSGGYVVMTTDFFPRETLLKNTSSASSSTDSLSSLQDEPQPDKQVELESTQRFSETHSGDFRDRFLLKEPGVNQKPIQVLVFTASEENELYLGPDHVDKMAQQIINAKGSAGSNVEYVTKTADFVRMHIPEDEDSHLFSLDAKVRELVFKAHASAAERVRLGLSDIVHELHEAHHDQLQTAA